VRTGRLTAVLGGGVLSRHDMAMTSLFPVAGSVIVLYYTVLYYAMLLYSTILKSTTTTLQLNTLFSSSVVPLTHTPTQQYESHHPWNFKVFHVVGCLCSSLNSPRIRDPVATYTSCSPVQSQSARGTTPSRPRARPPAARCQRAPCQQCAVNEHWDVSHACVCVCVCVGE